MKSLRMILVTLAFCPWFAGVAFSGNSSSIMINYEVEPINEVSTNDGSMTMTINSTIAGSGTTQEMDSSTYNITTNCGTDEKKLTAAIDTAMPPNLTLELNVSAPTGASSLGPTVVTDKPTDVVTAIDAVAEQNIVMDMTLTADATADPVSSGFKTLTLTLTDSQ